MRMFLGGEGLGGAGRNRSANLAQTETAPHRSWPIQRSIQRWVDSFMRALLFGPTVGWIVLLRVSDIALLC